MTLDSVVVAPVQLTQESLLQAYREACTHHIPLKTMNVEQYAGFALSWGVPWTEFVPYANDRAACVSKLLLSLFHEQHHEKQGSGVLYTLEYPSERAQQCVDQLIPHGVRVAALRPLSHLSWNTADHEHQIDASYWYLPTLWKRRTRLPNRTRYKVARHLLRGGHLVLLYTKDEEKRILKIQRYLVQHLRVTHIPLSSLA